jgi:hypothetical protein
VCGIFQFKWAIDDEVDFTDRDFRDFEQFSSIHDRKWSVFRVYFFLSLVNNFQRSLRIEYMVDSVWISFSGFGVTDILTDMCLSLRDSKISFHVW